ncbi:baseplate protein [Pseudomonas marginalis]|uniref:Baseplate protein n=2 Tax=Gammaproteobacteria TaxID=1236 RepID=A0A9X9FXT2_PSEMA|nr:contractile injection system protein, VgrG/Pvc8 family [Pseudomonas marginalis]TWR59789.1 baseplate protein [Pseudomonas marginalis]SED26239.1 Mu-like prophage tail protein gpP [Pseudomonas marginalis]
MDQSNIVTLSAGGYDYAGWKSVRISAGLERQARDFELGITWSWPGGGDVPVRIKPGEAVEVRIGRELILTGYVSAAPVQYDGRAVNLSISGKSRTGDLVDCAAINTPGQWRAQSVQSIVAALAGEYGITVVDDSGLAQAIDDHTIEPGETAFESIDRLLTLSRLFSTDDGRGRLIIASPGSAGRAADRLVLGENILTGDAQMDFSNVFSQYVSKGQRSGTDTSFGVAATEVEASVTDDRIGRKRVKVIQQSGQLTPAIARARVVWERANAISKALAATYKCQGWRQSNGELWRHNMIVRVVDPTVGFDRDMLITEISYELDEQGTFATLSVAPPDGFLPEPNDAYEKRKLRKGKKTDNFEYLIPADYKPS